MSDAWAMFLLVFDIFLLLQIVGVYILFLRDVRKQVVEEAEFIMGLKKLEFDKWVRDNAEYFAHIIKYELSKRGNSHKEGVNRR